MAIDTPDAYPYEADRPDVDLLSPRGGFIGMAESRLMELAEDGKTELARSFDELVLLAHEFAARIESVGGGPVAGYVRQATDVLEGWQTTLRDRPVQLLLDDGRNIIRRQPEIAIGVAAIAGFIAARLIKSGSAR